MIRSDARFYELCLNGRFGASSRGELAIPLMVLPLAAKQATMVRQWRAM
jgi:hypothetical protein